MVAQHDLRVCCVSMMNGNERKESQHENNLFLDREIQKSLLSVEEGEEEEEVQKTILGISPQALNSTNTTTTKESPSTGNKSAIVKGSRLLDDFEAWCPDPTIKLRKPDKQHRTHKDRDFPRWESISSKDYRPKEISFVFKHHREWRRYMDQYRQEHTYNFGPLGERVIDKVIPKLHPYPDQLIRHDHRPDHQHKLSFSHHHHRHLSPPTSARATRTRSDPNIQELADKYKLNPTIEERGHSSDISSGKTQKNARMDAELKQDSDSQTRSRSSSAKSQRTLSTIGKTNPSNPSPLSIIPAKIPAIKTSSVHVARKSPPNQSPRRLELVAPGAFQKQFVQQISPNGLALDGQSTSRVVNSKSPPLLVSNNQIRTMDLLSHVSTVDKQETTNQLSPEGNDKDECSDSCALQYSLAKLPSDLDPQPYLTNQDKEGEVSEECDLMVTPNITVDDYKYNDYGGMDPSISAQADRVNDYGGMDPSISAQADRVNVMRRYMMDLAEYENDYELRDRLRSAPDVAFRTSHVQVMTRDYDLTRNGRTNARITKSEKRKDVSLSARKRSAKSDVSQPHRPLAKSGRARALYQKKDLLSVSTHSAAVSLLRDHRFHNPKELPSVHHKKIYGSSLSSSKLTHDQAGFSVIHGLNHSLQDKLWFDASGRAYVSLATRYDPVHK